VSSKQSTEGLVKNWIIKHEQRDAYWCDTKVGGWGTLEEATKYSSIDHAYALPLYGKWINSDTMLP
jgi:hypothetical protein